MDYEKKYKEALELARVAAFNGHQSLMEGIFPELKESEDEKTRKALISFLKSPFINDNICDWKVAPWIAWLENIPYTIDHEKREGFHLGYKAALENQGEQNPAEWSEKDESLRLRTIGALETCKIGSPTKCVDEQINWLKSLKQRIGG